MNMFIVKFLVVWRHDICDRNSTEKKFIFCDECYRKPESNIYYILEGTPNTIFM